MLEVEKKKKKETFSSVLGRSANQPQISELAHPPAHIKYFKYARWGTIGAARKIEIGR